MPRSHSWVRLELAASAVLIGLSALWVVVGDVALAPLLAPAATPLAIGGVTGLCLTLTLPLVTASWARRVLILRGLHRAWMSLESAIGSIRPRDALVLAVASGVSEEVFFRGVLQQEIGLLATSVVFGALHPLGTAYVLWATVVGAGLGMLLTVTGSLLAPIAAHAVYNLVALTYLRRCHGRRPLAAALR